MHVLIWPTTFSADIWALAEYLGHQSDVDVTVSLPDPEAYQAQPIARFRPVNARFVRRRPWHSLLGAVWHGGPPPDVTVMDNRVPLRAPSKAGFMLWHGFGWKGPNDEAEFAWVHGSIARAFGDAKQPNPHFRWQAYGPWDQKHRTEVSGFHPDNIVSIGSVSHDVLREPWDRHELQAFYDLDIVNRPTVLFAPTWHYGEVFAHWGSDETLMRRLVEHCDSRGANLIFRLHDSFRYEKGYVRFIRTLAAASPHVRLRFKDTHPDNIMDLQVADVLLTNYSSIANLFYATRRPTVHLYPVRSDDEAFMWRKFTALGITKTKVKDARFVWKLDPEDHGGLMARSFDETLAALDAAIDNPGCCQEAADDFLARHMHGADGRSGARALASLRQLTNETMRT
jgi:hypothetical protein